MDRHSHFPRNRRRGPARLATALLLVALAACGGDGPAADRSGGGGPGGARCLAELESRNAVFERAEDFRTAEGCGIDTAVTLTASAVALARPMETSCALALAFDDFQSRVLQPAARRHLGQPVVRVHHFGSYSCRGRSSDPSRLSEHAFARAVDLAGFELADGSVVTVEDHWRAGDARAAFLRDLGAQACSIFGVVLGPSADGDHQDHFHFDLSQWSYCKP